MGKKSRYWLNTSFSYHIDDIQVIQEIEKIALEDGVSFSQVVLRELKRVYHEKQSSEAARARKEQQQQQQEQQEEQQHQPNSIGIKYIQPELEPKPSIQEKMSSFNTTAAAESIKQDDDPVTFLNKVLCYLDNHKTIGLLDWNKVLEDKDNVELLQKGDIFCSTGHMAIDKTMKETKVKKHLEAKAKAKGARV